MITKLVTTAGTLCLGALVLSACVPQSQYDAAAAENQRLKAQLAAMQAEQKYVEAADICSHRAAFSSAPPARRSSPIISSPNLKGSRTPRSWSTAIPTMFR